MISTIHYDYTLSTFVHEICLKKAKVTFQSFVVKTLTVPCILVLVGSSGRYCSVAFKKVFREKNFVFARYRICVVS